MSVWTTPKQWTPGEVVTAAMMNTYVSDNTQYLKDVVDGLSSAARSQVGVSANRSGDEYGNLTGSGGPTISVSTGALGMLVVAIRAKVKSNREDGKSVISYEVKDDQDAVVLAPVEIRATWMWGLFNQPVSLIDLLTPAEGLSTNADYTVTMKYKAPIGTMTAEDRVLWAFGL